MSRASIFIFLALLTTACDDQREPPVIPPGVLQVRFERVPYETTLDYITDLAFTPDASGEFLAIDLYGKFEHARLDAEGAVSLMSGNFDDVYAEFDAGQLGLAIDPDFADNGFFYIATNLARNHVQLRRYTLVRDSFSQTHASEVVILELRVESSPRWHNITSLGFDEEGVMWVLVGEKGLFDPAQDETNVLGSLIRILPSKVEGVGGYTTPEGGPTYSPTSDPAVYAIGIRSPWKGRYHEGRWFFGDVGLEDFEEVNVIDAPGKNFGWPVVEGPCEEDVLGTVPDCSLYDDPWIYYGRSSSEQFVQDDLDASATNKRSVYVGWIYQPTENDPYYGLWNDVVVWGDAYVGFMRAAELTDPDNSWHLGHMQFPTAWGQAPDGFVYLTSYPREPPDEVVPGEPPSPLFRVVIDPRPDDLGPARQWRRSDISFTNVPSARSYIVPMAARGTSTSSPNRLVDRLVHHGEVISFRELCARVVTPRTRYLVLDLDRTIHLGRDLGQDLGWELCAYQGYGREHFEGMETRHQSGRFVLDWDHPRSTARYLARSFKIWAYPGAYYGLWGKAAARLGWLRRRGFRHFIADPVRAAQRLPQLTLLRHLQTTSEDVLRELAQHIWRRHERDQVIDREDVAWVRARWPQIEVVLTSASPKPTVEVAGEALDVDHVHYSTLDQINSGEAKIERLRELCDRVGDPDIEIVGISDTSRGEDHCWAHHFTCVVDINSPTPFPAIVSSNSPLREVHSATLLTKHERERRAAGDPGYLDARRSKLAAGQGKLELTREELERRLGWLLDRVNALASAPGEITGDIAYRLAVLQETSANLVRT